LDFGSGTWDFLPNDMEDDGFEMGILVVAMRLPAAGLHVDLDVAGHGRAIGKLQHRAAKIRAAFRAGEARMQHAEPPAVAGLQLVAPEALVLPDGLEDFFRRHGTAVAEEIDGAAAFPPGPVEIFRPGIHPEVFCATAGEVN